MDDLLVLHGMAIWRQGYDRCSRYASLASSDSLYRIKLASCSYVSMHLTWANMFKARLVQQKKKVKGRANWILRHMVNYWCIVFFFFFLNLKSNMRLFCSHMRKSLVASGDITAVHSVIKSFVLGPLCCRIKRRNPKQIYERALAVVKALVPPQPPFFLCSGSSDWVHSSCTLSIERSDLLACQGKHCSRKQSKSTYLAPLKLLLFSLANLCNSHGEAGKEFDEAYNDD